MLIDTVRVAPVSLDWAIVAIKTALENGADAQRPPQNGGARKIALMEESGGCQWKSCSLTERLPPLT